MVARPAKQNCIYDRIRLFLLSLMTIYIATLFLFPYSVGAEEPTATATATATATSTETPVPIRFFSAQIQTRPLTTTVGPLQEVQGKVVAKTGEGIDGVRVRASSTNWQAFEVTDDGGKFKFALTNGSYSIQLVDMVAGEVRFTLDGKSELQIQFLEVDSPAVLPTLTPTVAPPTPTATVTETPTASATPYPTSTPIPPVETGDGPPPAPAATSVPSPLVLPFSIEVDPAPWLRMFLWGTALGGALIFVGLLMAIVRR